MIVHFDQLNMSEGREGFPELTQLFQKSCLVIVFLVSLYFIEN